MRVAYFALRQCFTNAQKLAMRGLKRIVYVEGLPMVQDCPISCHHGWNTIDGIEFDITAPLLEKAVLEINDQSLYDEWRKQTNNRLIGKEVSHLDLLQHVLLGGFHPYFDEEELHHGRWKRNTRPRSLGLLGQTTK
jgi:hypothetical protein